MEPVSVNNKARNEWLKEEQSQTNPTLSRYEIADSIRSQAVDAVLEHKKEQLIELLREGSTTSLKQAGSLLQASRSGSEQLEEMMKAVMQRNGTGRHQEILQLIAVAFCKNQDSYSTWTHSLCHNFEKYGAHDGSSILDFVHHREIVLTLLEEVAQRLTTYRTNANNSRILYSLVEANFYNLKPEDLDKPFILMTKTLCDPRIIAVYENDKYSGNLAHFLSSKTPREYLEKLVANYQPYKQSESQYGYDADYAGVPVEYFGLLENSPKLDEFWKQSKLFTENGISTKEAAQNKFHGKVSAEVVPGIFVDVDGTLTNYGIIDLGKALKGYSLNTDLYQAIQYLPAPGTPVTIFTGGDPEEATQRLRELGVAEKFLPVRSKAEFKGQLLEYVIDDTKPALQGFGAVQHYERHYMLVKSDPWKQIAQYNSKEQEENPVAATEPINKPSPIPDLTQAQMPNRGKAWWKFW